MKKRLILAPLALAMTMGFAPGVANAGHVAKAERATVAKGMRAHGPVSERPAARSSRQAAEPSKSDAAGKTKAQNRREKRRARRAAPVAKST
ncbi:MAG: hypothetical protein AAGF92_16980 [Myxococcota bacterium]